MAASASPALAVHHLTDAWVFKESEDAREDAWMPVKKVPTNVHLDLIDNGKYAITWGDYLEIIDCA
jgi:hypothetical protein